MADPHKACVNFPSPTYYGALKKVPIPPNGRGRGVGETHTKTDEDRYMMNTLAPRQSHTHSHSHIQSYHHLNNQTENYPSDYVIIYR